MGLLGYPLFIRSGSTAGVGKWRPAVLSIVLGGSQEAPARLATECSAVLAHMERHSATPGSIAQGSRRFYDLWCLVAKNRESRLSHPLPLPGCLPPSSLFLPLPPPLLLFVQDHSLFATFLLPSWLHPALPPCLTPSAPWPAFFVYPLTPQRPPALLLLSSPPFSHTFLWPSLRHSSRRPPCSSPRRLASPSSPLRFFGDWFSSPSLATSSLLPR